MTAYVTNRDGGSTFSKVQFVNDVQMQTYAVSPFIHKTSGSKEHLPLLTSLSTGETIWRMKDTALIKEKLGIKAKMCTIDWIEK
jgi:hypothetical protein